MSKFIQASLKYRSYIKLNWRFRNLRDLIRSNEVLAILTGLIKSDHSRAEDMSRRLQSMACDWSGGKLNADIQQRLMSMSKLLTDGDFSGAERIRVALAMDYSTECVAWITAIKHIIPASSDNVQ